MRFAYLLEKEIADMFVRNLIAPPSQKNFIVENSFMHFYFLRHLLENNSLHNNDLKSKHNSQLSFNSITIQPSIIN